MANTMIDISNILSWFKPTPKYVLPIAIVASVLLFTPQEFLSKFGAVDFVDSNRAWILVIFLLASVMLVTLWGYGVGALVAKYARDKQISREKKRRLLNLSPEEKVTLSYFVLNQTKSQELPYGSGVTSSLIRAGIIYMASHWGAGALDATFNIQSWAWAELNRAPELLDPELSELRNLPESTN